MLLVFYVPNKYDKYKKKEEKFYNLLLKAQDREEKNFQLSHKTDLEWKEEVYTLLRQVQINPENCTINIWGNYDSNYATTELVELCAEINNKYMAKF